MKDITISIVTYNSEQYIEKLINSLVISITKTLDYMIYIIDNNSNDNTKSIIRELENKHKVVIDIIENEKNIGFGAAHNMILNKVNSKYHIAVNPDIVVANKCIIDLMEYMDNHTEIGLISPLIKYPTGETQYLCKRNPTLLDLMIRLLYPNGFKKRQDYFTMMNTEYNKVFNLEYATGCFMLFRTEVLKKLMGFDEKIFLYLEDADITRRVNQISRSVFYPYSYVIHEWERGSHKRIKLMIINIKSAIYYFRKWGVKLF
jgi:GT2 family glycosyltransferase